MSISGFFRKIFSTILVGNCLGMVLVTVALGVGTFYFLDHYTHHGREIDVPDLKGQNAEVAMKKLERMGLRTEVADTGYVETLPADVVLEQSISAGEKVKPGRLIALTVNASGARTVALPDVADNCSYREARAKLEILGFRLTPPEYISSDDRDWVYGIKVNGKSVSAGTRVSVKTPVTLVIGDGQMEEAFNGNDSLDYMIFGTEEVDSLPAEEVNFDEDNL
ncbi:MAG TPA: PASTA domain-containing protein [Alloprevotella sp.]|nr:PASTA domain-containing protein [Alloprevotella sp.]